MIEIRNDEIGVEAGQRVWPDRLAGILLTATPLCPEAHNMPPWFEFRSWNSM